MLSIGLVFTGVLYGCLGGGKKLLFVGSLFVSVGGLFVMSHGSFVMPYRCL